MRRFLTVILLFGCWSMCFAAHDWHAHTLQQKDGLSSNNIECIFKDSYGFMWFGTSNGLDRYDAAKIRSFNQTGISVNAIMEVSGTLYVGMDDGLYVYEHESESLVPFTEKTRYHVVISSPVTSMLRVGATLVIGTYGQGVFFFDSISGNLRQTSIGIPFITDLAVSSGDRIYVSAEHSGVHAVSFRGDYISSIFSRKGISRIMSSGEDMFYLCRDDSQMLGCFREGRCIEKRFSLSLNEIYDFSSENILIGSRTGLWEMNKQTFVLKPFVLTGHSENLTNRSYGDMFRDEEGTLWVASHSSGVIMISEKNDFLRDYPLPAQYEQMSLKEIDGDKISIITDVAEYGLSIKDDVVSVAGKGNSSEQSGEMILTGHNGNIYRAVGNCVYCSTPFEKDIHYHKIGHKVENLFCDRLGNIWAGTSGKGLWRMDGDEFKPFIISSIYGNANLIYSIEQDTEGNMWVCTDIGIVKIEPETERILTIIASEEARSENRFLYRASLRSSAGVMYFGRREGLLSFYPAGSLVNDVSPTVTINSMSFRNGRSTINNLYRQSEVTLPYSCNSFTLTFSVHSYQDPQNNSSTYSLSSVDEQEVWSKENIATYSNLRPGKYVFKVRGKNNDGVESEKPAIFKIIITPPWWLSRLAFVFYTLLVIAFAAYVYRLWKRRFDKKYSDRLRMSREAIEQEAYQQKINFFLGMVHEIRTPLTIMKLSLDNVISSKAQDKGSVQSLQNNLNYMMETVNGILTFHKKDSGGTPLILSRTDIVRTCRTIVARFDDTAKLKKITLDVDLPDDPIYIMADEAFLSKIIINLLSNAFKYAVSTIRLSVVTSGESVIVRVSDDGPGVKSAEKEKIFEMFYKAAGDKVAEASGLGVGLAYSRQLALEHDGTLELDDRIAVGASFVLTVPLLKERQKELIDELGGAALPTIDSGEEKLRVLIVEDNVELVTNMERRLSQWYSVRVAYNGEEALRLVEAEDTDIIVSDVMMPVMDGMELCRQIKGKVEYSHIPFIMLTAKINIDDKKEGMESGADAYVEKPFSITQIHHQIRNLIRLRDSLREKVSLEVGRKVLEMPKMQNARDAQFMSLINAAIEEQIRRADFSIEVMADTMCMSKANFYRKFKAITGTSPNEYMKTYRLNRAAAMIAEGARINEAADAVGFESSSYFAKCFKAKFGVLPNDYQKK